MTIFSKTILGKILGGASSVVGLVVPGVTAITNVASGVLDKISSAAQQVKNGVAAANAKSAALQTQSLASDLQNQQRLASASTGGTTNIILIAIGGVVALFVLLKIIKK